MARTKKKRAKKRTQKRKRREPSYTWPWWHAAAPIVALGNPNAATTAAIVQLYEAGKAEATDEKLAKALRREIAKRFEISEKTVRRTLIAEKVIEPSVKEEIPKETVKEVLDLAEAPGVTVKHISQKTGVSERRIRKLLDRHKKRLALAVPIAERIRSRAEERGEAPEALPAKSRLAIAQDIVEFDWSIAASKMLLLPAMEVADEHERYKRLQHELNVALPKLSGHIIYGRDMADELRNVAAYVLKMMMAAPPAEYLKRYRKGGVPAMLKYGEEKVADQGPIDAQAVQDFITLATMQVDLPGTRRALTPAQLEAQYEGAVSRVGTGDERGRSIREFNEYERATVKLRSLVRKWKRTKAPEDLEAVEDKIAELRAESKSWAAEPKKLAKKAIARLQKDAALTKVAFVEVPGRRGMVRMDPRQAKLVAEARARLEAEGFPSPSMAYVRTIQNYQDKLREYHRLTQLRKTATSLYRAGGTKPTAKLVDEALRALGEKVVKPKKPKKPKAPKKQPSVERMMDVLPMPPEPEDYLKTLPPHVLEQLAPARPGPPRRKPKVLTAAEAKAESIAFRERLRAAGRWRPPPPTRPPPPKITRGPLAKVTALIQKAKWRQARSALAAIDKAALPVDAQFQHSAVATYLHTYGPRLEPTEREEIVAAREGRESAAKVAKRLGLPKEQVERVYRNWEWDVYEALAPYKRLTKAALAEALAEIQEKTGIALSDARAKEIRKKLKGKKRPVPTPVERAVMGFGGVEILGEAERERVAASPAATWFRRNPATWGDTIFARVNAALHSGSGFAGGRPKASRSAGRAARRQAQRKRLSRLMRV